MKITQDKTTHPDMEDWNLCLRAQAGLVLPKKEFQKLVKHLYKHGVSKSEFVTIPLSALRHFSGLSED